MNSLFAASIFASLFAATPRYGTNEYRTIDAASDARTSQHGRPTQSR
jgi:hypothetical protein